MFLNLLRRCCIAVTVITLSGGMCWSFLFAEQVVDAEKDIPPGNSIFRFQGNLGDDDIAAFPNPVRNMSDPVRIVCRTRCTGTALMNIYDAVGRMVHSVTKSLEEPEAMGHELFIPWDLRNNNQRLVGNGTYHCVVRIFDTENRLIERKKVNIGVAFER